MAHFGEVCCLVRRVFCVSGARGFWPQQGWAFRKNMG